MLKDRLIIAMMKGTSDAELVFQVHESEMHIVPKLKELMEDLTTFRCPLTVDVEIGNPIWGEKEAYEW